LWDVKPLAIAQIELEGRAVGQHRPQHVALRGPTLHTALRPNLEPIRAAEQNLHALVTFRHVKDGEAASGPRAQLQVRRGDIHLQMLTLAAHGRSREEHE